MRRFVNLLMSPLSHVLRLLVGAGLLATPALAQSQPRGERVVVDEGLSSAGQGLLIVFIILGLAVVVMVIILVASGGRRRSYPRTGPGGIRRYGE